MKSSNGLKGFAYVFTVIVLGLLAWQWIQNGKTIEKLEQHAPIFEMSPDSVISIKGEVLEDGNVKDALLQMVDITKNVNKVWVEFSEDQTKAVKCVQCQYVTAVERVGDDFNVIPVRSDSVRFYQSFFEPEVGAWVLEKK